MSLSVTVQGVSGDRSSVTRYNPMVSSSADGPSHLIVPMNGSLFRSSIRLRFSIVAYLSAGSSTGDFFAAWAALYARIVIPAVVWRGHIV